MTTKFLHFPLHKFRPNSGKKSPVVGRNMCKKCGDFCVNPVGHPK
jgi:hypothetical protein